MEHEILISRVADLVRQCENSYRPQFLGFLSREEAALVSSIVPSGIQSVFFGGYESAERVFLGIYPETGREVDDFPIDAVTFSFRKCDSLSHRDFLGSLMALGIKRETVGDILIENGRAVAFVSSDISKYIIMSVTRIGGVGVSLSVGYTQPLPISDEKIEITVTIASQRLDCVVAALVRTSRTAAAQMILSGIVSVNSQVCQKVTKNVDANDCVTVRSKGKFRIKSINGLTKKGRNILLAEKYK